MYMSFSDLKKNRQKQIDSLIQAAESATGSKSQNNWEKDAAKFWKPTVDKSGNGYAVIRFLPGQDDKTVPWVRFWDHGFQGPGGLWYIERSLTSIGQADPLGEMNTKLWNTGLDSDKELVRQRKRRLHYVSNIYVVEDSANPEMEGKVFMYTYGKKIFDKLNEAMQPEFADETAVNPFDLWEGANFKLKIRKVEGYRNYDKSEFADVSELVDGDDTAMEAVFNTMYVLEEYVDASHYKSYDELNTRLSRVLGASAPVSTAEEVVLDETVETPSAPTADADETLSYFAKLAQEG